MSDAGVGGQTRLCVSLELGDVEAWLPIDAPYPEYRRVVEAVAGEGKRRGKAPAVWIERWPQVLDDANYRWLLGRAKDDAR